MRFYDKKILRSFFKSLKLKTFTKSWEALKYFKQKRLIQCFKRIKLEAARSIRALHIKAQIDEIYKLFQEKRIFQKWAALSKQAKLTTIGE